MTPDLTSGGSGGDLPSKNLKHLTLPETLKLSTWKFVLGESMNEFPFGYEKEAFYPVSFRVCATVDGGFLFVLGFVRVWTRIMNL